MPATRASLLATVLLAAGCGGAPRGGAAGGGGADPVGDGPRVAADAPQSAFAARFPDGRNEYWCQWVEDGGYTAEKRFTPIEVTAASVKIHPTGETKYFNNFVEYPIDSGDAAYVRERDGSDEQRSVVLADGVLYMMVSPTEGAEPAIALACATKAEQRRIAGVEPRVHRERVRGYAEARRQAFLASASDLDLGDLALGDVDLSDDGDDDGDDGDDDAPASRWTPAQAEQIAGARTMTSFTFQASARDEGSETAVVVIATLADGSTMRIGRGNPIFEALFDVSTLHGSTGAQVEVIPLDETGAQVRSRLQYQEIAYTFEGGSYSLHCEGEPGKTGVDQNWNDSGAMFRHGQRGDNGPDVTVEITTASSGGALRYRLRCGDQQKVFNASASTEVIVSTTGGKGGHAIPKADGSGANGGNGGDGGDVIVIVDPSVQRYNLKYGSNGGEGGRGSQSRGGTYGNGSDGRAGLSGQYIERRQPVTIP